MFWLNATEVKTHKNFKVRANQLRTKQLTLLIGLLLIICLLNFAMGTGLVEMEEKGQTCITTHFFKIVNHAESLAETVVLRFYIRFKKPRWSLITDAWRVRTDTKEKPIGVVFKIFFKSTICISVWLNFWKQCFLTCYL